MCGGIHDSAVGHHRYGQVVKMIVLGVGGGGGGGRDRVRGKLGW